MGVARVKDVGLRGGVLPSVSEVGRDGEKERLFVVVER